ncbi:MAG: MarR family transcriptional regulator [Conexibacter sp.]|jgi:DNA-binding MarR family transcriptional regulator|nr:MarR family transcriptional regulator [Conexibacter sp.]
MDEMKLVDRLVSVATHVEAELDEALAGHGLSRTSYGVLDALARAEGEALSQRALMTAVRRTSGALSVRLGRLERAGLIARAVDPGDRRSVTVTLTDAGRELQQAAAPAYEGTAERLAAALPDVALAQLDEQLGAWLAFFEPSERIAPQLGVAVAGAAVAARMRRDVGLPETPGVIVRRVARGSAAERAGIARGDLVVAAAGSPVRSVGDLERAVRGADGALDVELVRGVEPLRLAVALTREPAR